MQKNYYLKWEILDRTKKKLKNNKTSNLCSLEKNKIEKINKESSLNKSKKDSNPVFTTKDVLKKNKKY